MARQGDKIVSVDDSHISAKSMVIISDPRAKIKEQLQRSHYECKMNLRQRWVTLLIISKQNTE